MIETASQLLAKLPIFLMIAVATHLVMSFVQTVMHYQLGHHPMGGKFFRNHINFHHTYYSKDHLVSRTYLGDEGNNTPFFFIPVFLVGVCTYFLLPFDLFVVQIVACAASFCESASNLDPTPVEHQIIEAEVEFLIWGVFDRVQP